MWGRSGQGTGCCCSSALIGIASSTMATVEPRMTSNYSTLYCNCPFNSFLFPGRWARNQLQILKPATAFPITPQPVAHTSFLTIQIRLLPPCALRGPTPSRSFLCLVKFHLSQHHDEVICLRRGSRRLYRRYVMDISRLATRLSAPPRLQPAMPMALPSLIMPSSWPLPLYELNHHLCLQQRQIWRATRKCTLSSSLQEK